MTLPDQQSQEDTTEQNLNLNLLLYVASFLLVAAAAAFVTTVTFPVVRIGGLWLSATMFYGVGLWIHQTVIRLRPAAKAFVGTGMAILPFAGITLTTLGGCPSSIAWFITSTVGVAAYLLSLVIFKSQFVGYLSIATILSFACSAASLFGASLFWYFTVVLLVAIGIGALSALRPGSLPAVIQVPLDQTTYFLSPLTLAVSLFLIGQLPSWNYAVLFATATLNYLFLWMRERGRRTNLDITRIGLSLTVLAAGASIASPSIETPVIEVVSAENALSLTAWLVGISCCQGAWTVLERRVIPQPRVYASKIWFFSLILLISIPGFLAAVGLAEHAALTIVIVLGGAMFLAIAAAFSLVEARWACVFVAASTVIPWVVGAWLLELTWFAWTAPWIYLAGSFTALLVTHHWMQRYPQGAGQVVGWVALGTWLVCGFFSGLYSTNVTGGNLNLGLYCLTAAIVCVGASHLLERTWSDGCGVVFVAGAVFFIVKEINPPQEWKAIVGGLAACLLYSSASLAYRRLGYDQRSLIWCYSAFSAMLVTGIPFVFTGNTSASTVSTSLMFISAIAALSMAMVWKRPAEPSLPYSGLSISYGMFGLLGAVLLGGWWSAAGYTVLSAVFLSLWLARPRVLSLLVAGEIALVLTVTSTVSSLGGAAPQQLLISGVVTTILTGGLSVVMHSRQRQFRVFPLLSSALTTWTLVGLAGVSPWDTSTVQSSSGSPLVSVLASMLSCGGAFLTVWGATKYHADRIAQPMRFFSWIYCGLTLLAGSIAGPYWLALSLALVAVACYLMLRWTPPRMTYMAFGNLWTAGALLALSQTPAGYLSGWGVLLFEGIGLVGLTVAYLIGVRKKEPHKGNTQVNLSSVCVISTGVSLIYASAQETAPNEVWYFVVASLAIIYGATLVGVHGVIFKVIQLIDVSALLVLFFGQIILSLLWSDLTVGIYGIISMLGLAGLGVWRVHLGHSAKPYSVIAAITLTTLTGSSALGDPAIWGVLFLVIHLAVATLGAFKEHQWVMWWGASASIAAVLYFLRGVTFLWLAILGMSLIGLVVWRLATPEKPQPSDNPLPQGPKNTPDDSPKITLSEPVESTLEQGGDTPAAPVAPIAPVNNDALPLHSPPQPSAPVLVPPFFASPHAVPLRLEHLTPHLEALGCAIELTDQSFIRFVWHHQSYRAYVVKNGVPTLAIITERSLPVLEEQPSLCHDLLNRLNQSTPYPRLALLSITQETAHIQLDMATPFAVGLSQQQMAAHLHVVLNQFEATMALLEKATNDDIELKIKS